MCVNIHGCIRFDTGGCDLVARQRQLRLALALTGRGCLRSSGVARAFPGEWERKKVKFQEKLDKLIKIRGKKMRKVELLPTRDCEAGYGPAEVDIPHPPKLGNFVSLQQWNRVIWWIFLGANLE